MGTRDPKEGPASPPLLQPLFFWNFEDKTPFAPSPQHLLLAVVGGVGHIEDSSCRGAGH